MIEHSSVAAGTWALAGLVPGLICLLLTPALMYVLYPPEVKDTPDAPAKVSPASAISACAICNHAQAACVVQVLYCLKSESARTCLCRLVRNLPSWAP
jgi:hypothetical protein